MTPSVSASKLTCRGGPAGRPVALVLKGETMKIQRIDHVGITVNDLPAAKAFFVDLGLEVQGEVEMEGEWLDRVIGLTDRKSVV